MPTQQKELYNTTQGDSTKLGLTEIYQLPQYSVLRATSSPQEAVDKTHKELGTEENFLELIKGIYKIPNPRCFLPQIRNKRKITQHSHHGSFTLQSTSQQKSGKADWREGAPLSPAEGDVTRSGLQRELTHPLVQSRRHMVPRVLSQD